MYIFTERREKKFNSLRKKIRISWNLQVQAKGNLMRASWNYTSINTIHPPYVDKFLTSWQLLEIYKSTRNWNLREALGIIHPYTPYIPLTSTIFDKLPSLFHILDLKNDVVQSTNLIDVRRVDWYWARPVQRDFFPSKFNYSHMKMSTFDLLHPPPQIGVFMRGFRADSESYCHSRNTWSES